LYIGVKKKGLGLGMTYQPAAWLKFFEYFHQPWIVLTLEHADIPLNWDGVAAAEALFFLLLAKSVDQ
jgi:hypothetical protein